jgi:hypothetical protein
MNSLSSPRFYLIASLSAFELLADDIRQESRKQRKDWKVSGETTVRIPFYFDLRVEADEQEHKESTP